MALRIIVDEKVGLGTPNQYLLACPQCTTVNKTPDAGRAPHTTADGRQWYYFDCVHCGCHYKAIEVPLDISHLVRSTSDVLKSLLGGQP